MSDVVGVGDGQVIPHELQVVCDVLAAASHNDEFLDHVIDRLSPANKNRGREIIDGILPERYGWAIAWDQTSRPNLLLLAVLWSTLFRRWSWSACLNMTY